jgi:hypothetical protein
VFKRILELLVITILVVLAIPPTEDMTSTIGPLPVGSAFRATACPILKEGSIPGSPTWPQQEIRCPGIV